MTSAPDQDRAPIELPHRVRLEILGAVLLGIFLAALDQTIVGTALPVIVTELNGNEFYVWAFTAYLVTSTISGPIYGKLSDLYGRRPLFIIGILIFLLGSILSGLSQEMWQLIAFRGLLDLARGLREFLSEECFQSINVRLIYFIFINILTPALM